MTMGLACDRDGYDLRTPQCSICGSRGCPKKHNCKPGANPMTTNDHVPSEKAIDAGARAAYDRGAVFFTSDAFVPWQELPETTREEWREIVRPILIAASPATPADPTLDPATVEAAARPARRAATSSNTIRRDRASPGSRPTPALTGRSASTRGKIADE